MTEVRGVIAVTANAGLSDDDRSKLEDAGYLVVEINPGSSLTVVAPKSWL